MHAASPPHSIRVLIADDDALFSDGMMRLLDAEDRIEVIGQARNGSEAVALVRSLRPDLVLMDVSMPGMDGIEATALIKERDPQVPVLIVTASSADEDVRRATAAGAAGYLTKDAAGDVVATIIELAALSRAFTATTPVPGS